MEETRPWQPVFELEEEREAAKIKVIGLGGGGSNAINRMIGAEFTGVEFIVANTDAQALNNSIAEQRIQLGPEITQGLGAGSRPEVGRAAAEETLTDIERALGLLPDGAFPSERRDALELGIATLRPEEMGAALDEPHPSWMIRIAEDWIVRYGVAN